MKITIDIPEELYETIVQRLLVISDVDVICKAIIDGKIGGDEE